MKHQGKRRGQGRRVVTKRKISGFLQPIFLLRLYGQDRHGYDLLQGLQEFVSDAESYDPSIIYRIMRNMEGSGWVTSYDGTVSRGPRRRMYSLTEEGKKQLAQWMSDLQRTKDEINHLLTAYRQQTTESR
ncbi:MAG: helix-turn-helix transcriptional regulator [Desulfocapsa sp.]|nr:helix-turn-helix transcriptional regulator [Desulfocapsa sp.]MBN4052861.1 helix-turn-helix transcriptional regulator [bacterium AH-315-K15]MBN4063943.1 helix-turn-helix transcriptional regulator [bacterium AH-315-I07]